MAPPGYPSVLFPHLNTGPWCLFHHVTDSSDEKQSYVIIAKEPDELRPVELLVWCKQTKNKCNIPR